MLVGFCLPQCSILWKGINYCHKMLSLICSRSPKYSSICTNMHCILNNLNQVAGERQQLANVSSMCDQYIWLLRFDISQQGHDHLVKLEKNRAKSSDKIIICKKRRDLFKYSCNAFEVSLTKIYTVVDEKKKTDHFYNNRKLWTDKR